MRTRQAPESTLAPAALERWESWPLWAIGLSNGLNIALWFVLSMVRIQARELNITAPPLLNSVLPWLIVAGAVAAALSLDGVLIAAIAGARHGRVGLWTWATIGGAGVFSAAIAYAVHAGRLDDAPVLHIAQALVLVLYNLHLSQPRKDLTPAIDTASGLLPMQPLSTSRLVDMAAARPSKDDIPAQADYPKPVQSAVHDTSLKKPCRHCGHPVTFIEAGAHGRNHKRHGACVGR